MIYMRNRYTPLIALVFSAIVLVTALSLSLFFNEQSRIYRSSAATVHLTPIPTPPGYCARLPSCRGLVNCHYGIKTCSDQCPSGEKLCNTEYNSVGCCAIPTVTPSPVFYTCNTPGICCSNGRRCILSQGGRYRCTGNLCILPSLTRTPTPKPNYFYREVEAPKIAKSCNIVCKNSNANAKCVSIGTNSDASNGKVYIARDLSGNCLTRGYSCGDYFISSGLSCNANNSSFDLPYSRCRCQY